MGSVLLGVFVLRFLFFSGWGWGRGARGAEAGPVWSSVYLFVLLCREDSGRLRPHPGVSEATLVTGALAT